jgi:hypothetical protein
MTPDVFHRICAGLCDATGAAMPAFVTNSAGNTAASLTIDDVDVRLWYEPARAPDQLHVSMAFGELPRDNALATCRALMDINSLLLWNSGCSFCHDTCTGQIMLMYAYPLEGANAADLARRIGDFAAVAHGWREHRFLAPASASKDGTTATSATA